MPRIRVVVAVSLLAAGCSFFTAQPVRYFEVRPQAPAPRNGPRLPSIIVPTFSTLSAYDHLRVVVRRSPVEVITSRSLQWTTVPGRMLSQGLRYHLEGTERFETVRRDADPVPPYTVEGQVQTLELIESPVMIGRIAIHVNVRRSEDGTVVGERFVDESLEADGDDVSDGVLALRALYARILDDLAAWIIAAIEEEQGKRGPGASSGTGKNPDPFRHTALSAARVASGQASAGAPPQRTYASVGGAAMSRRGPR